MYILRFDVRVHYETLNVKVHTIIALLATIFAAFTTDVCENCAGKKEKITFIFRVKSLYKIGFLRVGPEALFYNYYYYDYLLASCLCRNTAKCNRFYIQLL